MNGSGVKGVGIDIGSALDLYIFMSVTISCLCTSAQDGRGVFWFGGGNGGFCKGLWVGFGVSVSP